MKSSSLLTLQSLIIPCEIIFRILRQALSIVEGEEREVEIWMMTSQAFGTPRAPLPRIFGSNAAPFLSRALESEWQGLMTRLKIVPRPLKQLINLHMNVGNYGIFKGLLLEAWRYRKVLLMIYANTCFMFKKEDFKNITRFGKFEAAENFRKQLCGVLHTKR